MDSKDKDPQPTGRIVHDERGNAVWKSLSAESTSSMLRRLDLAGLSVEGEEDAPPLAPQASSAHLPQPKKAAPATDVKHGYNPYDQSVAIRKPTTPKGPVVRPVQPVVRPVQPANPMPAAKPKT